MNAFGPLFRKERKRLGLSQAQVCERLAEVCIRMDRTTLSRIERQKRMLTDIEVAGLIQSMGIALSELQNYASCTEAPHREKSPESCEEEGSAGS